MDYENQLSMDYENLNENQLSVDYKNFKEYLWIMKVNPSHKLDFHNPQILTSCRDKHKLLILESLYIQLLKPNLNLDSSSYPLRLFNV